MVVQWTGSKGLDGVASVHVCGNPVLCWAKVSLLGIEIESVIIFGNNIYFCTSVNLGGKGVPCVYHWGLL